MEKYSKILIYIFLLTIINIGISSFLIYKINIKPETKTQTPSLIVTNTKATPQSNSDIKSDLTTIKAEIRALRETLEVTGLISETPKP